MMKFFAYVVFVTGLLPGLVRAEPGFVEQFKFSGGIVVALDFEDGQSIAELAVDGPFTVHALLRDEAQVAAAKERTDGRKKQSHFLTVTTSGISFYTGRITMESRRMMSGLLSDSAGMTRRSTEDRRRWPRPLPIWSPPMACC